MDNTNKIRKLLWEIRSLTDNDEPKPIKGEHEPCFPRIVRLADEVLALLPCETCNDSGRVVFNVGSAPSGLIASRNCPDCQGESNG